LNGDIVNKMHNHINCVWG